MVSAPDTCTTAHSPPPGPRQGQVPNTKGQQSSVCPSLSQALQSTRPQCNHLLTRPESEQCRGNRQGHGETGLLVPLHCSFYCVLRRSQPSRDCRGRVERQPQLTTKIRVPVPTRRGNHLFLLFSCLLLHHLLAIYPHSTPPQNS